jgi:VanZ family protein
MTMWEKRSAVALWGPPIALMVLIFVLSSLPSDDPDRTFLQLLVRKVFHFSEYALLAALWWRALRTRLEPRAALITAFTFAAAYAVTDEIHQTFVDTRVGTPVDVLIDLAGAAAAIALIARRRERVPA